MTVQELPQEIIQKVFEYVAQNDLYKLLFICKSWHFVVKNAYLQNVDIRGKERVQRLKEYLSTSINEAQIIQPLYMTKQLCIAIDTDYESDLIDDKYTSLSTQLTKEEFLLLLSRFPNLQKLVIKQSAHRVHYMKILCDSELEELPLLEEIDMDNSETEEDDQESRMLNLTTYKRFQRSLKQMDTICIESPTMGKSFMDSLVDFTSLRTLYLFNDSDPDVTIFLLFQACPNLSHLGYHSNLPISEKAVEQLTNMLQKTKGQSISQFPKYLKKVKLTIPTLALPYIDFFTNHRPKILDDLEIDQTDIGLYQWIDSVTVNVAFNFCKSLQKLTAVRLMFAEEFLESGERIDLFYQILNVLTGERKFQNCSALHRARVEYDRVAVDICIAGSNLSYEYSVGCEDYQNQSVATPFDLSQLSRVNEFKVSTAFYDVHYIPTNYLDYVQKYCPRLTQFYVDIRSRSDFFLKAECLDTSKSSMKNMTHITVDNAEYSKKLMNILIDYFPRIKVLNFTVDPLFEETKKVVFNLSKFKYLRTLIINIHGGHRGPPYSFFIRYRDNKRLLYYTLEEPMGWGQADKTENNFRLISADDMQRGLEDEKRKDKYAIYVEGHQQLVQLELMKRKENYARVVL